MSAGASGDLQAELKQKQYTATTLYTKKSRVVAVMLEAMNIAAKDTNCVIWANTLLFLCFVCPSRRYWLQ